jgi:Flp pilus assembly protein TadD
MRTPDAAVTTTPVTHPAPSREQLAQAAAECLAQIKTDPSNPALLGRLASLQLQLGLHSSARDTLQTLCDLAPAQVRPLIALASVQMQSGDAAAAVATLRKAVAIAPSDVDAHHALGEALVAANARDEAKRVLRQVVEMNGSRAQTMNMLCDLWIEDDELGAARSLLERLVAQQPNNVSAQYKLGYVNLLAGDLVPAERRLAHVAGVLPDYAPTFLNLGSIASWNQQPEKAEAYFRQALALQPGFHDALESLSMVLRAQGKYREGWKALGAHSAAVEATTSRPFSHIPLWDGRRNADVYLLVYFEQGLGDTIQFARYLRLARRRVGRISLAAYGYHQPLHRLLQSVEGADEVLDATAKNVKVSKVCSLMSLPFLLDLETADPEPRMAYLAPPPADVAAWAARLQPCSRPRVGLVWAGNPRPSQRMSHMVDRRRSVGFDTMRPLLAVPDVQFVSLQLEDRNAFAPSMLSFASELRDMADTAALIESLDLVISVDTSIAHLAGALGKPVWLLNRFDSCWRWGIQGETTQWYASMRIFRQPSLGDWLPVIARVARELAEWRDIGGERTRLARSGGAAPPGDS